MDTVAILPPGSMGHQFIPDSFLPEGEDEYYLRNEQVGLPQESWRHLHAYEVERLVKNGNTSTDWDDILVTDSFDPGQIKNSDFFGRVRIGRMQEAVLQHHDLQLPVGITNSRIVACDLKDDVAIHDVRYLAHYIIGNRCILANIDEMHTTNYAKFGNGIVKQGEEEKVRVWLDIMNEAGARRVLPFEGMIPADAYLWGKFREDSAMLERLKVITQERFDERRGFYGQVGDQCVVKNSRILKDVKIGAHCYIKGANKLKNLTINSNADEPTQIGEGVELVNGIIGFGCHIFYGCKAVRFVLGDNSNLKYGARLINSYLGDNSTISCCEVLNNLIFPAHEQHHNNSFLIASVVMGQSNVAAGATIGSNHNSRANDNEIQAGRGFWPGLCTSVKHPCRFASFVLLAKADYPAELDIPLPFSLVNNNSAQDRLEVMPAFWWLYNMYALARNAWKFSDRDQRKGKLQNIEFDALAPDTVEEILAARRLLQIWTARAVQRREGSAAAPEPELAETGAAILSGSAQRLASLEVLGEEMEKSRRKVLILKPDKGYAAYNEMILLYAVKNIIHFLENHPELDFSAAAAALEKGAQRDWINLGGQLVPAPDVERLRRDIAGGRLGTWDRIHSRYDELWDEYPLQKQKHAYATLCHALSLDKLEPVQWTAALEQSVEIQRRIRDRVLESRKKDFDNPFKHKTFRNMEEMEATIGTVDQNSFIEQVSGDTEEFIGRVKRIKERG